MQNAKRQPARASLARLSLSALLMAAVAALAVAGVAAAQESVSDMLKQFDANGDGMLQRDEAPIELLPRFDEIDQDRDNSIDSFEAWEYETRKRREALAKPVKSRRVPVARPEPREPAKTLVESIERRDANGDGRLSREEVPQSMRDGLKRLDQDGDGFFDLEEARKLDAQRLESQRTQVPGPGRRRTLARTVNLMDTDGDGLLQKKEAPLRIQRVFERLDRNGDGAIDLEEARAEDAASLNP